MKRFLSMLLVIVLLAAAIPTAAFADRTSSITVTFKAFDLKQDKAFREWAGYIIDFYVNTYTQGGYNDLLNESISVMKDYSDNHTYQKSLWGRNKDYNPYSLNYDALTLEDKEQAEEMLKYTYLEQLSESVQKQATKLSLGGFDSRDTGKWLTLDAQTGQWTYSYQLEAVTKLEQNKLIETTIDTAIKAIDRVVNVYNAKLSLSNKSNDVFETIWSCGNEIASNVLDDVFDYLNKELKEQLRSSICKDIENNIITIDDAAITYLKKTYIESASYTLGSSDITEQYVIFPTEKKIAIFEQAVHELLTKYEQNKAAAETTAANLYEKISVLDKQELKKTTAAKDITQIVLVDILRSVMNTFLDVAKKKFFSEEKNDKASGTGNQTGEDNTKEKKSLGALGNTIFDALKGATNQACEVLIKKINDKTTGSESLLSTFEATWRDEALKLLKSVLTNMQAAQWNEYYSSLNSSKERAAKYLGATDIFVDIIEIAGDVKNGRPIAGEKVMKIIEKILTSFFSSAAVDINVPFSGKVTKEVTNTLKDAKGAIEDAIKIIDPIKWLDVASGVAKTAKAWNDAKKGNAAADYTAFKMYQDWEVGSYGIQRGVAGFPSKEDVNNSNKTSGDYLAQKVSQILMQLNTESTCIRQLQTILGSQSDLKKAVVTHFEKKGVKEDKLKEKLANQYEYIRRLYDAWDEQQQHNFPEYFN